MEEEAPARRNRGKSSEDEALFSPEKELYKLRSALADMRYLLSNGYPVKASIALVGNRYRLKARQLLALQGMCASDAEILARKAREASPAELKGEVIYLDGFNILILLETALSGGYIFKGPDGCYRDISSVHGTYKKVNQTEDVFVLAGNALQNLEVEKAVWVFDKPVSNSGKLKSLCYELAEKHGFNWEIRLDNSPDKFLAERNRLACTSDAWILNNCARWFNLGAYLLKQIYADLPAHVIEL